LNHPSPKNSPPLIRRSEWIIVAGWIAALLIIVAAPIVDGYLQAKPGTQFSGFVGMYHNDYNSYLAWIRQAADGHALFRILFTAEPHARHFFHPLFWGMGLATRITGAPLIAVWYGLHAVGCVFMIWGAYAFGARFTDDRTTRALALALTTTASGFGWLTRPAADTPWVERAIDLWMPEANLFQSTVTSFFTLPIALGLMLWSMIWALRYFESGRLRDALIGGGFALALVTVHQYDVVTLFAVLGVWTLLSGRKRWPGMLLLAAVPLPYMAYSAALMLWDPVLSQVSWTMPVPTIKAHLMGWGLPLLAALAALSMPRVRRDYRNVRLLAGWLVINVALLVLPIEFRRKLIWGLYVPICLLAAMGAVTVGRTLLGGLRPRLRRLALGAAGAALVVLSAWGSATFYAGLFERNRQSRIGDYLPDSYLEALAWLDDNARDGEVVLATPGIAALVPGRTGNVVFWGHWAQTIDPDAKQRFLLSIFSDPSADPHDVLRILQRNRVRYIVADGASAGLYRIPADPSVYAFRRWVRPVFVNPTVRVWEVADYRVQADDEPWPSGDWRGP
jgi:hypothetical protein